MLKPATACLIATLAAVPALAQTGDRPTATGSGSTTAGSPSMRPGTAGDQTVTSPANPSTSTMGAPTSTAAPSTTAAPMTPGSNATTSGSSGGVMSSGPTAPAGSNAGGMSSGTGSTGGSMSVGSAPSGGSFIAKQQVGQMLASSLIGTTVVSQANETIGDVNDILFDRNGQVTAAVIGVGGFLGIGEKDVAVPFGQMEFVAETAATAAPAGGTAPNTSGTNAGSVPATTGATNAPAAVANAVPSRVMLKMSKADLQAAPTFEQLDRTVTTTPAGAGATGTTSVPRQ